MKLAQQKTYVLLLALIAVLLIFGVASADTVRVKSGGELTGTTWQSGTTAALTTKHIRLEDR